MKAEPFQQPQSGEDVTHTAIERFDIAIVGGAMAGATLALGLSRLAHRLKLSLKRPLKIALIEASRPGAGHPGFDARSIAIAHGSVFELTRLGLWPALAHLGTPIANIHVSDRGHFGMTELNAGQFNLASLGQVVELERVGQLLFEQLEQSYVSLFCPDGLASVEALADGHLLTLTSGKQLHTSLLVAADGAHSRVRRAFNQPQERVDFGQHAVIANIVSDTAHNNWAWERFTDTGPLALLPMGELNGQTRLSLVWALDQASAERMQSCDEGRFLAELQCAFGYRAGRFVAVGQRHSYPLTLSYMPRPVFHRCVFIGNAAQTLHPIAGQGFNLGLRDVACLLEQVERALIAGTDLGSTELTLGYLAARERDRKATIGSIEFLVRGFSNDYWPLACGRSLALRLLSWLPPLKTPVAHRAMGLR
jgi:2-octaprenyl-6-methoxyphenol hydroxylase